MPIISQSATANNGKRQSLWVSDRPRYKSAIGLEVTEAGLLITMERKTSTNHGEAHHLTLLPEDAKALSTWLAKVIAETEM